MENQIQKFKKENNDNQLANYKKLQSQLKLISEGQEISRDEMRRGFIGLAQQNQELVKLNKQLTQQLETVVEELNQIKQERREKEIRKQTRANRKIYFHIVKLSCSNSLNFILLPEKSQMKTNIQINHPTNIQTFAFLKLSMKTYLN